MPGAAVTRIGKLTLMKSPTDFVLTTLADISVMCREIKLSRRTSEKSNSLPY